MENMAKKGGIYLDSNFLDQGSASNALYSKINQTGTHMVGVGSYKVNVNIQNINEYTKTAIIADDTDIYRVTLDEGVYDEIGLGVEVKGKLDALGLGVWTVTYDPVLNKYSVQGPVPVVFQTNFTNGGKPDWVNMLGIEKNQAPSSSFQSQFYVNISYTDCLYFTSEQLYASYDKREYNTNGGLNHLCVCYLNNSNKVNERIENVKWINVAQLGNIDQIDIRVLDSAGRVFVGQLEYVLEIYTV